jgi:hypothetical protein
MSFPRNKGLGYNGLAQLFGAADSELFHTFRYGGQPPQNYLINYDHGHTEYRLTKI